MKFFVTGVGGQLGHDVMNELLKRGHEGVGSDIQMAYSGIIDNSPVSKAPYIPLDITDADAARIPIRFAMAAAVTLWSPVIMIGLIPALIHSATASLDSTLGGSIMEISPRINQDLVILRRSVLKVVRCLFNVVFLNSVLRTLIV